MLRTRPQTGITLIALIITVIVMLILVGVTINVALNGELFTQAQTAVEETQIEADREQLLSSVVGAIGTDAKVDFNKLDSNLPSGWTGSDGTYKSPKGNVFTVDENGTINNANDNKNTVEGTLLSEIYCEIEDCTESTHIHKGDYINYTTESSDTEWVVIGNNSGNIEILSINSPLYVSWGSSSIAPNKITDWAQIDTKDKFCSNVFYNKDVPSWTLGLEVPDVSSYELYGSFLFNSSYADNIRAMTLDDFNTIVCDDYDSSVFASGYGYVRIDSYPDYLETLSRVYSYVS